MKFQVISDTHERHYYFNLEESDVIIFAGDSNCRWDWQLEEFFEWFSKQPSKYKIFVPGNHDWYCQLHEEETRKLAEDYNIIYLADEEVIIEGHKFYGSPFTPDFCNWAFMLPRGEKLAEKWKNIPEDTDVLITHGPPRGILDLCRDGHVGCQDLLERVYEVQPKFHVFGHIHEGRGQHKENGTTFINGALLNGFYRPYDLDTEKGEL